MYFCSISILLEQQWHQQLKLLLLLQQRQEWKIIEKMTSLAKRTYQIEKDDFFCREEKKQEQNSGMKDFSFLKIKG